MKTLKILLIALAVMVNGTVFCTKSEETKALTCFVCQQSLDKSSKIVTDSQNRPLHMTCKDFSVVDQTPVKKQDKQNTSLRHDNTPLCCERFISLENVVTLTATFAFAAIAAFAVAMGR